MAETAGLDIINTSVDTLSDDSASWPLNGLLECHGFSYRRIGLLSPRTATERLAWLSRQKLFASQPYQPVALVLKDEGDDRGARQVLYEMEHLRRSTETGPSRFWNLVLRFVIGYGYRPWRALGLFIVLVLSGALLFSCGFYVGNMVPTDNNAYRSLRDKDLLPDHYERFHPIVYSLENSLPLFKLGQVDRWQPDPAVRVFDDHSYSMTFRILLQLISPTFLRWYRWFQVLLGLVPCHFVDWGHNRTYPKGLIRSRDRNKADYPRLDYRSCRRPVAVFRIGRTMPLSKIVQGQSLSAMRYVPQQRPKQVRH
jgi:hypothetical protein